MGAIDGPSPIARALGPAAEFIDGVDTGTVYVNDCNNVHAELAWCGTKGSGNMVGGLGLEGFRAFTYPRSVLRKPRLPR